MKISLLTKIYSFGVSQENPESKNKVIKMLNTLCIFWYLAILITSLSSLENFSNSALLNIGGFLFIATCHYLNKIGRFALASMGMLLFTSGYYFTVAYFSAPGTYIEFFYLLQPSLSLIFFDRKVYSWVIFAVSFGLFYYTFIFLNAYDIPNVSALTPKMFFIFLCNYLIVFHLKSLNVKNEGILEEKTQELEQLDQFKSQFFTNISHEIRTPLTIINGHISELNHLKTGDDIQVEKIEQKLKKQINAITALVDNVLDLAKMQSSGFSLNKKTQNVSDLIRRQYLNFEPLFTQKGLNFSMSENEHDYLCSIDPVFFERALNNVIVNALKYTDEGSVSITISKEKDSVQIAIADTGIGIAESDVKSVFNQFYQVNNDINKSGGSGVGLTFTKEIIELHEGTFFLVSELGKGSTFTIKVPLEKVEKTLTVKNKEIKAASTRDIKPTKSVIASARVLIVEDNLDMREYLVSVLKDYECIEATNGVEALAVLKDQQVDFIITDYMMPKMDGREFIVKLKTLGYDTPVIMLTAKTDANSKLDILRLGIDDYITKPFEKEELLIRMNNSMINNKERVQYNEEIGEQEAGETEEERTFVSTLKHYIYKKCSDDALVNQEALAAEFGISRSSLYRRVKSQTGLTPSNFIKEVRLQKARDILEKQPDILLKQLALEAGFSHQTYFSQIYMDRFGIKPCQSENELS